MAMTSKITVEIDFGKDNEVFLRILNDHDSEDVKDQMLKHFLQKLGYGIPFSNWLHIEYSNSYINTGKTLWIVKPVTPHELLDHGNEMIRRYNEANPKIVEQA